MRPITAGKCVCDGYTASTKVRPVTRTCDTGRAQDRDSRAWWQSFTRQLMTSQSVTRVICVYWTQTHRTQTHQTHITYTLQWRIQALAALNWPKVGAGHYCEKQSALYTGNKIPLKIWEKKEHGHVQGLPKFFEYPHYLRNGENYELQISYAHWYDQSEQKPIKKFRKSSRGRTQGLSKIFKAPTYRAPCAVIFAVAQLSCSTILNNFPHAARPLSLVTSVIVISSLMFFTCCVSSRSHLKCSVVMITLHLLMELLPVECCQPVSHKKQLPSVSGTGGVLYCCWLLCYGIWNLA